MSRWAVDGALLQRFFMYRIAELLPYNQKLPFFSPMSEAEIIVSCLSLAQLIDPVR